MNLIERAKQFLFGGNAEGRAVVTAGYEPPRQAAWGWRVRDLPPFDFYMIRMMLLDPTIKLGLAMRSAPVCSAQIAYPEEGEEGKEKWTPGVQANSEEVAEFVRRQTERFWRNDVPRLVSAQTWGWAAAEVVYRCKGGKILYDRMEERHAQDVRVLEEKGRMVAVRFRNVGNKDFATTVDLRIPKAFWHSYKGESGQYYPLPVLEGAYSAWWDKWMDGGALDTRRLFMHKDAYGGQTAKYPPGTTYIEGRGEVPNRDIAREIVEQAASGNVVVMPASPPEGPAWEFQHANVTANPQHILQYPQDLDVEILRGIEIPDDVLTAEASGSWEGKRVPQNAFYTGLDVWAACLLRDWRRQVMDALVYWNFGPKAEYELRHKPLALQAQEQAGEKDEEQDPFGGMFGGGGGNSSPPQGQPQGQQMSLRAEDISEIVRVARLNLPGEIEPDLPSGDPRDLVILEGQKARGEGKSESDNPYGDEEILKSILWSIGFSSPQAMSIGRIVRMSARAPKGGITIGGKEYKGGQFIPGSELSSATEKELNTLNKEANLPKIDKDSKAFKHIKDLSRLIATGKRFEAKNRLSASKDDLKAAGLEDDDIEYLANKLGGGTVSGADAPREIKKRDKIDESNESDTGGDGEPGPDTDVGRDDSGESAGDGGGGSIEPRSSRILTDREQHTGKADLGRVPERLRQHLNDDQQIGVAKAVESLDKHGGFLLADGTGVGKTRQLLGIASKYADEGKKVVIVAPAEVIKPNWKKGTAEGSYAKDGETMGVDFSLTKAESAPPAGKVSLTTYSNLAKLKSHVDKDTVVLFDESHYMKNSNSKRGKDGREIGFNAGKVMYATATPADKPLHIAHLMRAGVFGGGDPDSKKFYGKAADTYRKIGLKQETVYNKYLGKDITHWKVDPKVGYRETMRRISGLFDQMTKDGLMIQRSLSMDNVDAQVDNMTLPPEAHAEAKKAFDDAMAEHDNKAMALMAMRRAQEPHKIPATVDHVQKELAAGRQPIVFLGRVNDNPLDPSDEPDEQVDANTARMLKEALLSAGVKESDIGELHGGATKTADAKRRAMKKFNDGKSKVLISTIQSGGTGVNLDDTTGDRPRTVVMMTPPLSANDMIQAAGRINRLSTKSNAKIISLVSDNQIDQWNMGLLSKKMGTLGAALGKDVGSLVGESQEEQDDPFDWGESLIRKSDPKPQPKPAESSSGKPSISTRKVKTKYGERHVHSWAPSQKFWSLRKAGKLPDGVSVSKNNRTGEWEAVIWGKSPQNTQDIHDKLVGMGAA